MNGWEFLAMFLIAILAMCFGWYAGRDVGSKQMYSYFMDDAQEDEELERLQKIKDLSGGE